MAYWHSLGIQICVYLDDGAGTESNHGKAKLHSDLVRETLEKSGLISNESKSIWQPKNNLTWLGIDLCSTSGYLKISPHRVESLYCFINKLLSYPYTSARNIAKLTGKLASTKFVLGDIINLKTRALYKLI